MTWLLFMAPLLVLAVPVARGVDRLRAGARRVRHADCLRRIERLEVALGYREPPRFADVCYGPGMIFEVAPGAPVPRYFAPAGSALKQHALLQQQWHENRNVNRRVSATTKEG